MRAHRFILLAIGLTLLLVPWVVVTMPFVGPDEAAHYLRALAIANGQLLGPAPGPADRISLARGRRSSPGRGATSGSYSCPARSSRPGTACLTGESRTVAGCHQTTWTGDYFPLPYALPAAAIKLSGSHSVDTSLWRARAVGAVVCLVFLLVAAALAQGAGPWSLVGLLLALTPATLFIAAVLTRAASSLRPAWR